MKITMLEKVNDKREEGTRSAVLIGIRSFLIMVGKDAARKPPSQHLQEGGNQSLCGPLFYSLSHPPETVLSSGFVSVTLVLEAVYFAPLPRSSIYCWQILLSARGTRSWFSDSQ